MNEQVPKLPRKPFGYDPVAVERMLSERDAMLGIAERRIREAEARALKSEEQMRAQERTIVELREQASAEPAPKPEEPPPLSPKFMTEELSKIVMAAEETTSQILERARISTRDQILEADRLWREVQGEVVRFSSWREEADDVVHSLQDSIERAKTSVEALSERIRDALAPAIEAMIRVDEGLNRFSSAAALPLLLTPSGLTEARAHADLVLPHEDVPGPSAPFPEIDAEDAFDDPGLDGSAELDAFASGTLDGLDHGLDQGLDHGLDPTAHEPAPSPHVVPDMSDELRHHFQASGSLMDGLDDVGMEADATREVSGA
jgi:hypothetical protein